MSLFSKKAYVGLDIGHHAMKAVQVERTQSGWHVAKSISAPTPDDTVRDGVVIDPVLLGLAIKNMLKAGHIHASSAAIAISGGTVVVRPVRMPKMAESALRKSIRFEASRYVPNSVEDSYIEFEIIGDADATNMDVIIAAAPKELVDSRIQACQNAGLEVEHVEVAAFAAYRSVIEADLSFDWSDKTLGLVDVGASVTNLGVVSNGVFSMTRAIPAGGQVLTDALKGYFKLSDEDAESGKSQLDVRGLMNESAVAENPPLRVLHTHVDDLVREVRRSINYWQSQQVEGATAKRMDAIILFGGGANLPGLAEYFEHKLGIPTEAKGLFQNPRFLGAQSDADRGMDIAVAVGLSMGLAPAKVVTRTAKQAKPVAEKPAAPPKNPKPPKPGKGKTFKVSRTVTDTTLDSPEGTSERVEVAATAATQTIESVPAAFQPILPEVIEASTLPEAAPESEQPDFSEPESIDKYGPELAALLGDSPVEAPTLGSATPEVDHRTEVAALLEAAEEAFDLAPVQVSTTNTQEIEANPIEFTTPIAEVPSAPAPEAAALTVEPTTFASRVANATPVSNEKDALLSAAPETTSAPTAKPEKSSVFSKFGKSAKSETPAKAVKVAKVKETKQAKAPKAPKVAKEPKVAAASKDGSTPSVKSKLGAGIAWMFGSPKQPKVKPSAKLASTQTDDLLRGSDLDAVDMTLREAKPAPTTNPPAPKVLADAEAKSKTKETPTSNNLQDSDPVKGPKKEAA